MVEALRGLGYSPATALADLVDNSIAAGATVVDIDFVWEGPDSWISILDNGCGMDDAGLELAMRLGERDPTDERHAADLGRFGLGLKTASFSQARRLTVGSKQKERSTACLRWDLDILRDDPTGSWSLIEGPAPGSAARLAGLETNPTGTIVLWESMDRVVTSGFRQQDFLDLIDGVEKHLAMIFHRFLEQRRLQIRINGQAIAPWNPFLEGRSDTYRSGVDRFRVNGYQVSMEGFVLPHRDRLDPKTWEAAGGPDGWTSQQGFYVYRNERLLVAGHWLGLGRGRSWTKEEPFRLARIRLDIPNCADADWSIDVRKSTASPPVQARARLAAFAEDIRSRARRVFAFRGKSGGSRRSGPVVQAWRADRTADGIRYRIDTGHPAVATVLEQSGGLRCDVEAMLRVIETTVPVQQIWLDTAETKEAPLPAIDIVPPDEVRTVLETVFRNMVRRKGFTVQQARQRLLHTEPFHAWPEFIETLTADHAE